MSTESPAVETQQAVDAALGEVEQRLVTIAANLIRASYDDDVERMAAVVRYGALAVKGVADDLRARGGEDHG